MRVSYFRTLPGRRRLLRPSSWAIPAAALVLAILAGAAIIDLVARANSDREAQLTLQSVQTQLNTIQGEPYASGQPAAVRAVRVSIREGETAIEHELAALQRPAGNAALRRAEVPLRENFAVLERLRELVAGGKPQLAYLLDPRARGLLAAVTRQLQSAGAEYRRRAQEALTATTIGAIGVIALLLAAFMFFYVSAARSRRALVRLLARSKREALTDALTGLGNRRALYDTVGTTAARSTESESLAVILLDLDGFKAYNDAFGHLAGDVLLARLGERLASTVGGIGSAFRVGGDEFCVLAPAPSDGGESVARFAAAALSEEGEGFRIGCSYGVALAPHDGTDAEKVLSIADQRMYEHKRHHGVSAHRGAA